MVGRNAQLMTIDIGRLACSSQMKTTLYVIASPFVSSAETQIVNLLVFTKDRVFTYSILFKGPIFG